MFKIDQFTAANEAAINQFAYFAQLSLANVERFAELSLGAARESVEQATAHAQSLSGAKDVHEVIAINSAAVEPVLKRAYAYSRTAYDTATETNTEVKRVFEKQASEYNRAAVAALEEAFKYAPAGSETVVENVKTAIAAAQSAYNNVAAINKQIYDTVEKSVEQNVANVKSVATKAKAKSKKR
ncbi:MAG: phasin family protein [Burkholderiales bacterium]|nr:phasin family protein [Burkholderiales bacterium]